MTRSGCVSVRRSREGRRRQLRREARDHARTMDNHEFPTPRLVLLRPQVHVVKAGALPPLVELTSLGRRSPDVSRYCGMTLSNLACNRANRVPIVEAGGLKPLSQLAFDGERLELQRAAGLALYNLSCAAANQVRVTSAVQATRREGPSPRPRRHAPVALRRERPSLAFHALKRASPWFRPGAIR